VAEEANYSGNKFHKSGKHFALSTKPIDPQTATNYLATHESNEVRSVATGSFIEIDVTKNGAAFDITVTNNGQSYSRQGVALSDLGEFEIQSHWGSGVVFFGMNVTAH